MPSTSSVGDVRLVDGVDDPAVVHDADPVGQVEDVVDIVADQEDADTLRLELADKVANLRRLRRAKGSRRLVHDQDLALKWTARAIATAWRWPPDRIAPAARSW